MRREPPGHHQLIGKIELAEFAEPMYYISIAKLYSYAPGAAYPQIGLPVFLIIEAGKFPPVLYLFCRECVKHLLGRSANLGDSQDHPADTIGNGFWRFFFFPRSSEILFHIFDFKTKLEPPTLTPHIEKGENTYLPKMTSIDIQTPRLTLRSMDRQVITACLAGDLTNAGVLLGIPIPPDLTEHPSSLRFTLQQLDADPLYAPWGARAIILGQTMIGLIRFHSTPDPEYLRQYASHGVELGYRIFAAYRRQGYALEAVKALIQWAQTQSGVRQFIASISPDNTPSLLLAHKLGFKKIAETIDEIDGVEHVYSLIIK